MKLSSFAFAIAIAALALGTLALGPSALARPDAPAVKLRGGGKSREALNAMQLKPFDQGLWSQLSDWTGGPITAEATQGKPVLIVTWAGWYKVSHTAMRSAESLFQKYKDQGLIVVGVHNPREGDKAAASAKELGITFPIAQDKEGKFRQGLRADQDPNVYFIDRAGNLRFAQVETTSMDAAAQALVKETADQARAIPLDLEAKRIADEKARWTTRDASGAAPGQTFDVQFAQPDDDVYKKVRWPYLVGKVEVDPILDKINNDPPRVTIPEDDWVPAKPKMAGKIAVIYFIDPKMPDMLAVIPVMNRIQDQFQRDAVVMGSIFKIGVDPLKNQNAGEDQNKLKDRNIDLIRSLRASRTINHALNPNAFKAENLEFSDGSMIARLSRLREEFGYAALLSSDGKLRWHGNPYSEDLKHVLQKLIDVDPGVAARRKAEEKKQQSGDK